jgi:hypothetical protein
MRQMVLSILLAVPLGKIRAEDRIPIDAKINDRPVHLAFDTGAEMSVLYRAAAERLGLRITKAEHEGPIPSWRVPLDVAEPCNFVVGGVSQKATFGIIDAPPHLLSDIDGVIAWSSMRNQVVRLDFERNIFESSNDLPAEIERWAKWRLVSHALVLVFECTDGRETAKIGIDTGSPEGVWLSRERWEKWRGERAKQAGTITAVRCLADGVVTHEVLRAKKITMGGLALNDVPVSMGCPSIDAVFEHADAVLGLFALKQLKVVIDGKNGVLYTSPIDHPSAQYNYNRLGAVFVSNAPDASDDLVAHVVGKSPAYRAGIRDGDVLLKIGELDATKWRTDPRILPMHQFWSQPPGTRVTLTLKRNDQPYTTALALEEPSSE